MSKKEELIKKHGTLEELEQACKNAWIQGFVTFEEAIEAVEKYEQELAETQ